MKLPEATAADAQRCILQVSLLLIPPHKPGSHFFWAPLSGALLPSPRCFLLGHRRGFLQALLLLLMLLQLLSPRGLLPSMLPWMPSRHMHVGAIANIAAAKATETPGDHLQVFTLSAAAAATTVTLLPLLPIPLTSAPAASRLLAPSAHYYHFQHFPEVHCQGNSRFGCVQSHPF